MLSYGCATRVSTGDLQYAIDLTLRVLNPQKPTATCHLIWAKSVHGLVQACAALWHCGALARS